MTAQKREQSLQDVPVSITALSSNVLEANRVHNISDLSALAPNLTVRESAGGAGIPAVSMRGVLSTGVGPGADREVGYYVDGVYIGHSNSAMFELTDVERIEVLRGPQGTLFGRNATAGAISVVTRDPTGELGLRQELTYGNYEQFRSKTRLDLPALGALSASVSYTHAERRGDVRNLGAGTVWDLSAGGKGLRTSPERLGDENIDAVRAAVKLKASDSLTFTYKFDWADFNGTPRASGFSGFGPALDDGVIAALLASQPDPSAMTPASTERPDAVNNAFVTPMSMRAWGHNLTAQWQINDAISLKNVLAYRKARQFSTYELTGLGGLVLNGPFATMFGVPDGTPFLVGGSTLEFDHKQFSDEFQINVTTDPLTVTAGLLHYSQMQSSAAPEGLSNTLQFAPVPGNVLYCPQDADCTGRAPTKGKSNAAFVQAEAHLTEQLDLVGGFRVTRDTKSGRSGVGSFKVKDTNESYLIGVNYRPVEDVLLFAKYSTAFMSGGGNTGNFGDALKTYTPEFAKSWEGGVKADLFGQRLRTNLSLYTVKYADMQFISNGLTCGDLTAGLCVYNGGDLRAKGFEFEATAVPMAGLTLSAGLGYTHAKYMNLVPQATAATGIKVPSYQPKWTGNLAAQYDTRPVLGDAYLSFRLDANFRSKTLLTGEVQPQFRHLVTSDATWILNGRITLADLSVAGHRAELALWGRNLTNDKSMAFINSYNFMYPTTYERARTYGIDLKFDW